MMEVIVVCFAVIGVVFTVLMLFAVFTGGEPDSINSLPSSPVTPNCAIGLTKFTLIDSMGRVVGYKQFYGNDNDCIRVKVLKTCSLEGGRLDITTRYSKASYGLAYLGDSDKGIIPCSNVNPARDSVLTFTGVSW